MNDRAMQIWLVTVGEPVPVAEGARDRLHRTGYFAHFLADHGHQVAWWTSTFDHFRKQHWFDDDHLLTINDRLQIRLLHGCGYRSNVSLARLRDHRRIARTFAALARQEENPPDIIVAALPTIELCWESVRYGRERGVPVVLDMRDMWPDIFVDAVPKPARPAARFLLWPLFRQARAACAGATAIIGITEAFVDWGVRRGNRIRGPMDRAFPMGYVAAAPPADKLLAAERRWDELGIRADRRDPVACFIGTIGRQLDLGAVVAAARQLHESGCPLRFVLCGTGDRLEQYKQAAADLPSVLFPGWIDAAAIHVLMRHSTIGLDPLPDRYDFLATINNKAIEYLSAGLPIVSSPDKGVLADLLAREQCGISYGYGDVAGLADCLSRLCRDRERLELLAENARRVFQERFVAEKVYGQMLNHLEALVDDSRARQNE